MSIEYALLNQRLRVIEEKLGILTEPVHITAPMVKQLREETGCSMMQCKLVLEYCNGDMDKARETLMLKTRGIY